MPQLKKSGAKISNWEVIFVEMVLADLIVHIFTVLMKVMEKIKEMARPYTFPVFKVSKSSLEFIRLAFRDYAFENREEAQNICVRFECEIENYSSMEHVLAKLDMKTVKLSGFQVRVTLPSTQGVLYACEILVD